MIIKAAEIRLAEVLFIGAAAGQCTAVRAGALAAAEAEAADVSFDNNFLFIGKCFNLKSNDVYYEVAQNSRSIGGK